MDDTSFNGMTEVIAEFLHDGGESVAIKIEGHADWEVIDSILSTKPYPLVSVRRATDGHTLILLPSRIIAVDIGVGSLS